MNGGKVTKELIINLKQGPVKLVRPKAGVRNKALMKAETGEGIRQTTFMVELIPYCISEHPFGAVPIRQALDNLEIKDYDALIDAMRKLFGDESDVPKKSEELSGANDSQKKSGSETSS